MRIVYVPRKDAEQVRGGDFIYMMQVKKHLESLGVEIETVSANQLANCRGADLVHLTQLYQIDAAETALGWAARKRIPVVINPLFEDVVAMWFRWAVKRQMKWRCLAGVVGKGLAEHIYIQWQSSRRVFDSVWNRQRILLQRCHVVTNTLYEMAHLRHWFNLANLDGPVVPLGVDTELYGTRSPGPEELPSGLRRHAGQYILQVGLLILRKNQIGLLQALEQTTDMIVFLGRPTPHEPEYAKKVKHIAHERGNVVFIEYVPEKMLPVLYANARVHVLPSWSERPGMVTLEAAACNCKVITSIRTPMWEYLGDLAWYVDPANRREIRNSVQQAMVAETPAGLRKQALEYSWARTARELSQVYSTILSGAV